MTRKKKIIYSILLILLLAITIGGLYVYHVLSTLTSGEIDTEYLGVNKNLDNEIINIALFGIDGRDDVQVEGDRTDSIMIGTLDTKNNTIKVTSIMRDTFSKMCFPDNTEKGEIETFAGNTDGIEWEVTETDDTHATVDNADRTVDLENNEEITEESEGTEVVIDEENSSDVAEYDKINSAYNEGGVEASIKTLNENFDLNIQDYITVDFNCLMDVVDAVGGITLDIPNEDVLKWTNEYLKESNGWGHRNDPPLEEIGVQQVTGAQALAFARNRYSDSDFGRARRQREVVQAIFDKINGMDALTALNLLNNVYPYVKTSLTLNEVREYATVVLTNDMKFEGFRIPTNDHGTSGIINGTWYLFPDTLDENVVALHTFIYGPNPDFKPSNTVEQISQVINNDYFANAYDKLEYIGNGEEDSPEQEQVAAEEESMTTQTPGTETDQTTEETVTETDE